MLLVEGVALMATPDPEFDKLNGVNKDNTAATSRTTNLTTSLYTLLNQFFDHLKKLSSSGDGAEWFMDNIAEISEEFIQDNAYFLDQYQYAIAYIIFIFSLWQPISLIYQERVSVIYYLCAWHLHWIIYYATIKHERQK